MPSKKRKYNARFPAGRIKKIMQTDEEVGKVAQAVPIIISRTLELFVESLLGKALQVTNARNAKTLSPSHVKQTILAEARFDFLRDLVKNIPDVSAAEEKELMSAETSPNSSRFNEACALAQSRRIVREDSISSNSEVIRVPALPSNICSSREQLKRALSVDSEIPNKTIKFEPGAPLRIDPGAPSTSIKTEPQTPGTSLRIEPGAPGPRVRESIIPGTSLEMRPGPAVTMSPVLAKIKHKILTQNEMAPLKIEPGIDTAIDLSIKESKPANFYQETLVDDAHRSVIKVNPTYSTPSTSYTKLKLVNPLRKIDIPNPPFQRHNSLPVLPRTPITPVINIDFSKNISRPEIKVLDVSATTANIMSVPKYERTKHVSRQNSKSKMEVKTIDSKPAQPIPVDIDSLNSGNLQIDEDYDT